MGFIKKIGKIICFITLIFLLTYMVINLSLNNILSKKTISDGIKDVSFTELIYSDTFDNNEKIINFRSNLNKIYKIVSIFDMTEEDVNSLLDQSVKSDITSIMVDNVIYTIRTNENILLISEEDFNIILDDFIEKILNRLNINGVERELIRVKLVDSCKKLIKYVPDTEYIITKVSADKIGFIRLLINKNLFTLSIVLSLICILMMYVLSDKLYHIFKDLAWSLYVESAILVIFILSLCILGNTKLKFIQGIIAVYSNIIFEFLWLFIIFGCIFMLIYTIINKKKKLVS